MAAMRFHEHLQCQIFGLKTLRLREIGTDGIPESGM